MEEEFIYKHHQWWLIVYPRGTKSHWVDPSQFFYWPQKNLNRVGPRVINAYWFYPLLIFTI